MVPPCLQRYALRRRKVPSLEIVKLLLEAGADVNVQAYKWTYTALQLAIPSGCTNMSNYLDEGANPNAPCSESPSSLEMSSHHMVSLHKCLSALEIAIKLKNNAMVELFLQAGAEVNVLAELWTPLHTAGSLEDKSSAYNIVKFLLQKGVFLNISPENAQGRSIL